MQYERAAVYATEAIGLTGVPFACAPPEEAMLAAAFRLGTVQRDIRRFHELLDVRAIARSHGNPDAGRDDGAETAEVVGRVHRRQDSLRKRLDVLFALRRRLHDREFVAAKPRDQIELAHASGQPIRDDLQ